MATTTTIVSWNSAVATGPIAAAHKVASAEAERMASALAPGRIQVHAVPSGTEQVTLTATGPGAVPQEVGAGPHEIAPSKKKALAGPKFGPIGGTVHHPGNPALHYVQRGANTYPQAFVAAAKSMFI